MKPTKKEVEATKKKAKKVEKKKESPNNDVKDLQEIVVGMGRRLSELESLYKRVKGRLGL